MPAVFWIIFSTAIFLAGVGIDCWRIKRNAKNYRAIHEKRRLP